MTKHIYYRPDATGDGSGESWENAVTTYEAAEALIPDDLEATVYFAADAPLPKFAMMLLKQMAIHTAH